MKRLFRSARTLSSHEIKQRRKFLSGATAFILSYGLSFQSARSRQLEFNVFESDNENTYRYIYTNHLGREIDISFNIPRRILEEIPFLNATDPLIQKRIARSMEEVKKDISSATIIALKRKFKHLENEYDGLTIKPNYKDGKIAASYIFADLSRMADSRLRDELDVKIRAVIENYKYDEKRGDQSIIDDVENSIYMQFGYRKIRTKSGDAYLLPDYGGLIKKYEQAMRPVATAFRQTIREKNIRLLVSDLLAFFQSIPYDTLMDRRFSPGAGFSTPIGLIKKNKGDCDTKSTAFLSVMGAIQPEVRRVFVLMVGHAFVGLEIEPLADDEVVEFEGRTYVLMEPTGPVKLEVGRTGSTDPLGINFDVGNRAEGGRPPRGSNSKRIEQVIAV